MADNLTLLGELHRFYFLPDHDVVIKNRIKIFSNYVSRQLAKEGKKKFLTQRHRENRGLSFRFRHAYLVEKKILTRSLEAAKEFCFKLSWRLCAFA
ncbi:MAG: hypothetical protein COA78_16765 [Blastopirellula sp.]|nr:MAG: hypothetical protein COA78_16765 [Blastopirellula sp.]